MEYLQLKDICGYLPYGMYAKIGNSIDVIYQIERNPVEPISRIGIGSHNEVLISEIKPILRPMYDLTKTVKHKGEDIIPLVELAKINSPFFANQFTLVNDHVFVEEMQYNGQYWFSEWSDTYHFNQANMAIKDIDKLNELMFDYRGLIEKGLAIDVNTLKNNPYE